VLATWGGDEQASFLAMVKPFEQRTGIKVAYEGTRDLNAVLTTRVQGGNPPELAGLPGPGQMKQFAQSGKLIDLDNVLDMNTMRSQYSDSWLKLAQVDGKQYAIFIKSALKGQIWYDPKQASAAGLSSSSPPSTFSDLTTIANAIKARGKTPWCVGLESGAASGWPGTDWLEDIVLRQSGPQKYEDWFNGKLAWNSPEIKQAFQTWGQIVATPGMVFGGKNAMLSTNFQTAGNPLFTNPPGCYLHHQASFITSFFTQANPSLKPVDDFNFFMFPDINTQYSGAAEVAGDLFGMFKNTPQARQLIKYLATPEAQQIWVKRGGALSPNKNVPLSAYPDKLSQQAGQILTTAKITEFDASDNMPDAMNTEFWHQILAYVQNPSKLDSILAKLDQTRQTAYK
jgi:alpha-glucoside transport system substrate-binding protein